MIRQGEAKIGGHAEEAGATRGGLGRGEVEPGRRIGMIDLEEDGSDAVGLAGFTALTPLSPTLRLREGAGLHWRLLSHLKLGHLSLADGAGGPETLREMMRLYDYRDAPETHALIDAITGVSHRRSTARVAGGGMARGLDVEVEMDGRAVDPGQAFLFGQVLDRFFGLYVNLNGFTRLTLRLKGAPEPLHRWPPRSGTRVLA